MKKKAVFFRPPVPGVIGLRIEFGPPAKCQYGPNTAAKPGDIIVECADGDEAFVGLIRQLKKEFAGKELEEGMALIMCYLYDILVHYQKLSDTRAYGDT